MDPTALRNAAKNTAEVESAVHAAARSFRPETERAAGALGSGWATAAAMRQVVSEWSETLKRLADEIDHLGGAVEKSAENRHWAEKEITMKIVQRGSATPEIHHFLPLIT